MLLSCIMKIFKYLSCILLLLSLILFSRCRKDESAVYAKPPIADFEYTIDSTAAPATVHFINKSYDTAAVTYYTWFFGIKDYINLYELSSYKKNPVFTYFCGGNYTVRLQTRNYDLIMYSEKQRVISIKDSPPIVRISNIVLLDIPFLKSNGKDWDLWDDGENFGPDIQINVKAPCGALKSPVIIHDAKPSNLPHNYDITTEKFEITTSCKSIPIVIFVVDYDVVFGYEQIGEIKFTISDFMTGNPPYPAYINISKNGLSLGITLNWQ